MKTRFLMIALFVLNIFQMSAQSNDEVTLVVSADGPTKEEATKVALRSAIEQAYGTFVSANTTILNDDIVKDEIVTISNGNIKEYKEIASFTMPNGNQSVTLQATVCISKLISYAKSKGSSTEFAGATFMMNVKMKELNKKNEREALNNLLVQIKNLIPFSFDRSLELGTPQQNGNGKYKMDVRLIFVANENFYTIRELIYNTFRSISLSKEERSEYKTLNMETTAYFVNIPAQQKGIKTEELFYLRNDEAYMEGWGHEFLLIYSNERQDFKLVDNMGQVWPKELNDCLNQYSSRYVEFFGPSGTREGIACRYYPNGNAGWKHGSKCMYLWLSDNSAEEMSYIFNSDELSKLTKVDVQRQ